MTTFERDDDMVVVADDDGDGHLLVVSHIASGQDASLLVLETSSIASASQDSSETLQASSTASRAQADIENLETNIQHPSADAQAAIIPNNTVTHNVDDDSAQTQEFGQRRHRRTTRIIVSDDDDDEDNVDRKRLRSSSPFGKVSDDDEAGICSVCLDKFTISGSHRVVCLKCGHLFGQWCIERWIKSERHARCPQCKASAELSDIRCLYTQSVKALDNTELENLKKVNAAFKTENEKLRIENEQLKAQIERGKIRNTYLAVNESLVKENERLRSKGSDEDELFQFRELCESRIVRQHFTVIKCLSGPVSLEPGCRSLDALGEVFALTCKLRSPGDYSYGVKLIWNNHLGKQVLYSVHTAKPRCCKISPFDSRNVLSTGEDKTLCITRFANSPKLIRRIELPATGWCCCWLSLDEVAVGLISGRVYKININDYTNVPTDITGGDGNLPIISLHFHPRQSMLFVVSLKKCVLYHNQQPHVLISDKGAISSFCYNPETWFVMVTHPPGVHHQTVTHVLYKLQLNGETIELCHLSTFKTHSTALTRMTSTAFWNTKYGPLAAYYDETYSQLVIFDWLRNRPEVAIDVNDIIVSIKEVPFGSSGYYRLGCLSEISFHLFEIRC